MPGRSLRWLHLHLPQLRLQEWWYRACWNGVGAMGRLVYCLGSSTLFRRSSRWPWAVCSCWSLLGAGLLLYPGMGYTLTYWWLWSHILRLCCLQEGISASPILFAQPFAACVVPVVPASVKRQGSLHVPPKLPWHDLRAVILYAPADVCWRFIWAVPFEWALRPLRWSLRYPLAALESAAVGASGPEASRSERSRVAAFFASLWSWAVTASLAVAACFYIRLAYWDACRSFPNFRVLF